MATVRCHGMPNCTTKANGNKANNMDKDNYGRITNYSRKASMKMGN
jgi:hypothetical protein